MGCVDEPTSTAPGADDGLVTQRQTRDVLNRATYLRRRLDGLRHHAERSQTAATIAAVHERWALTLDTRAREKLRAAQLAEHNGDNAGASRLRRMATNDLRIAAAQYESAAWNLTPTTVGGPRHR